MAEVTTNVPCSRCEGHGSIRVAGGDLRCGLCLGSGTVTAVVEVPDSLSTLTPFNKDDAPPNKVEMVTQWVGPNPQWVTDEMREIAVIAGKISGAMARLTIMRQTDALIDLRQAYDALGAWLDTTRAKEWTS